MPKQRYYEIYRILKQRIEDETYPSQALLPSENELTREFDCSRNTVRRAVSGLIEDGYVQSMQGKGVRCIYNKSEAISFFSGEIETFREASIRNNLSYETRVVHFEECIINEKQSKITGFEAGEEVYFVIRVHVIDNIPMILNINYFLRSVAEGLTKEIAEASVYDFLEQVQGVKIVNAQRVITVEKLTELDRKYLRIRPDEYNCLAVMTNRTYEGNGILFEYTESRHIPSHFRFSSTAVRRGRGKA